MPELTWENGYPYVWGIMLGIIALFWGFGLFNRLLCQCCSPDEREAFPYCFNRRSEKRASFLPQGGHE